MYNNDSRLEEGTLKNGLAERSYWETNCCFLYVSLIQKVIHKIQVFCLLMVAYLIFFVTSLLAFFIYIHARPPMRWGKMYFLVLSVMAIILDPLFFYIPMVNKDKTCIEFNQKLAITTSVLRSIFDLLKVVYIIFGIRLVLRDNAVNRSRNKYVVGDNPRKNINHTSPQIDAHLWLMFLIDILAALPVPQVLIIFQRTRMEFLFEMTILCVVQYFPRAVQTFRLFKKTESAWTIIVLNLLIYMIGAHVFGALWYFFAIEKVSKCWKKGCTNHTQCGHSFFYCHNDLGDYNFLNNFCPRKTDSTASYDFGLYEDAIQSGILEDTDFLTKFLYCFRWGLQNLSAFGQNLQPSTSVWENLFAICMTIFGVVLFVFLIGKMQMYLQSHHKKSQKIRQTWQEIQQWSSFYCLSNNLRWKIRKYKQNNWQKTKRIDIEKIFRDLPPDLGKDIKRQLCTNLLSNVKELKEWNYVALLEVLYDYLKPVMFAERTLIIREGDPIHETLFVLKGHLWAYTPMNERTTLAQQDHLSDGDYCGEELIAWARNESSSRLPKSTRTIQALTNVEAFALMAEDLKLAIEISRRDHAARTLQSHWRFRNLQDRRLVRSSKMISKLRSLNHRIELLLHKIRLNR